MRKIILFTGVAAFFVLSFVSIGYSKDKNVSIATKGQAKAVPQIFEVSGQVTWCDSAGKYMMMHGERGQQVSLVIDKKTLVKKGKKKIKFSELKRGDKVLVKYEKVNESNVVKLIIVQEDVTAAQTKSHKR